jgi:hypothetical protein
MLKLLFSGFVALAIFAVTSIAAREIAGSEAAAIALALNAFRQIYAKPDLRHYTVEVARHGGDLEVTFMGDRPTHRLKPNETLPIGPSIYGPDMTYVVSLKRLKILRYNFWRD